MKFNIDDAIAIVDSMFQFLIGSMKYLIVVSDHPVVGVSIPYRLNEMPFPSACPAFLKRFQFLIGSMK